MSQDFSIEKSIDDIEQIKNAISELHDINQTAPNQSEIIDKMKSVIGKNRVIDLLNDGEDKHWKNTPEQNNLNNYSVLPFT